MSEKVSRYEVVENLSERVVKVNRNAKMLKGGRRFCFTAYVVVGNGNGVVGIGHGKAREVPMAVQKAVNSAKKRLYRIPIVGSATIPHPVRAKFESSQVILLPAASGTGVIACETVRALAEAAGIKNILTKSYGSTNSINLLKATMKALVSLQSKEEVEKNRGVKL
ncbi:MAG: 30S ribosomal protein S5 [Planctomycetota bacterium]|nr:30S ribosomal protein S5 [Planctomycetota bacterium]